MMSKKKVVPAPESVVIKVAERLYEMARDRDDLQELKTLAARLENSQSHLLEDIYGQCCIAIEPLVLAGILPGSVVESVQMMVEDIVAKQKH